RHVEMGKDHYTAAREGTAEIGLAVTATTFSFVAVFVPVGMLSGEVGQWMKPFALSLVGAVLVSLFVSFSLDPMLSAYWPGPHKEEHQKSWLTRLLDRFDRCVNRLTDKYVTVVGWARYTRKSRVALAIAPFFGAIVLQQVAGGAGFVPLTDRGEIEVIVEAPPSASLEFTTERTEAIAAIARRHPEVLYTYSVVGTPLPMRTPGVDQSNIYIRLNNRSERKLSQAELGEIMR